tara:strand:- start:1260 stop:1544 length:285 start_codon:yes stop_codon:yes gene_type:complete
MPKISETFSVGDRSNLTVEKLLELLETSYTDLAIAINKKPDCYQRASDGLITDTFLSNGDININTSTHKVEVLTSHPDPTLPADPKEVTWTQIS